jgi:hypothetical protein
MKINGRLVILALTLPIFVFAIVNNDDVRGICACIWMLLSIPMSIIWAIDKFRTSNNGAFFTLIVRVLVLTLGVSAIVISMGVIGMLAWDYIEKNELPSGPGSLSFIIAMMIFGFYMIRLGTSKRQKFTVEKDLG